MRQHYAIMSNKLLAKINVQQGSYLERGLASSVKLKGGKVSISIVKSFEYRLYERHNKIRKFADEKAKDGCGASPTCIPGASLRHAP